MQFTAQKRQDRLQPQVIVFLAGKEGMERRTAAYGPTSTEKNRRFLGIRTTFLQFAQGG
jgi:hypothetical protein